MNPLNKKLEIFLRKSLIRVLKIFVNKKNPPKHIAQIRKILLLRQDKIGDALISTPLISIIKKNYPDIQIDFLLSESNYFVFDNEPLVKNKWKYQKRTGSVLKLLKNIRKEKYDFVLDLMDNPSTTSTLLCLFTKAKWKAGLSKENDFIYDIVIPMLPKKNSHVVDRLIRIVTALNINPDKEKIEIKYNTGSESEKLAGEFLDKNNIKDKIKIGLNISPVTGEKFWGIDNFKKFIEYLSENYPDYFIIPLSQPGDKSVVKEIVKSYKNIVLSPETHKFDEFAAIVKKMDFIITPDTATVHLASAFKIPSVVLYMQTSDDIDIWTPYNADTEPVITNTNNLGNIEPLKVCEAFQKIVLRNKKEIK
jgi:ADP-heptose:LPS heptosyltransferase